MVPFVFFTLKLGGRSRASHQMMEGANIIKLKKNLYNFFYLHLI
jgi:hypothetical protein